MRDLFYFLGVFFCTIAVIIVLFDMMTSKRDPKWMSTACMLVCVGLMFTGLAEG